LARSSHARAIQRPRRQRAHVPGLGAHGHRRHGVRSVPGNRGQLGRGARAGGRKLLANVAGLLLFALGGTTMVLAILRFRKTSLAIDSDERQPGTGERIDVVLAVLLAVLAAVLFVYLSYTVIRRF
jgi:hypothetical protein